MFANAQMMGMDLAFPDVCKTPPAVPIPYPNFALGPTPITNGDNAGVLMGVVSQTVMGPSRHITGAFTVLLKGSPCTRMTSLTVQNRSNIVGMRIVPSQFKVLVLAP